MRIVKLKSYSHLCFYIENCIEKAPSEAKKQACEELYSVVQAAHKTALKQINDNDSIDMQKVQKWLSKRAYESVPMDMKNMYSNLLYKIDRMKET